MPSTFSRILCALLCIGIGLSACAPTRVINSSIPFDADVASIIWDEGTGTIVGQAFLRQRGGGVVTCAGEMVTLVPMTDHARDRFRQIYGSEQGGFVSVYTNIDDVSGRDITYASFVRTAQCDAAGSFEFQNVADGEYYVTTRVVWQVGYTLEGGSLAARVRVADGETAQILLN